MFGHDIELYKSNGTVESREHRKDTSAATYLLSTSAHPSHTFAGIVKSQLIRLRRICSNDEDFINSVDKLRIRCLDSGYNASMVGRILALAPSLHRKLSKDSLSTVETINSNIQFNVRLVILIFASRGGE